MEQNKQKKSLMERLFGNAAPTDRCPQYLFREEWNAKRSETLRGLATLITSLIPEDIVEGYKRENRYTSVEERIYNDFLWKKNYSVLEPWLKENPEPLMGRDEFLHYLCEYMLEREKGGAL